jgi:hypothetical protein
LEIFIDFSNQGAGVKEAVRFRKRADITHTTLVTIVMMCLNELEDIVVNDTSVDIHFSSKEACTVVLKVTMLYGSDIIKRSTMLQEQIKTEIEMMTPFHVENVHITVQKLVYSKNA